jgi:hypothetical protein
MQVEMNNHPDGPDYADQLARGLEAARRACELAPGKIINGEPVNELNLAACLFFGNHHMEGLDVLEPHANLPSVRKKLMEFLPQARAAREKDFSAEGLTAEDFDEVIARVELMLEDNPPSDAAVER